jgi:7-cyano-7-deazaguanine synthase
MAEQIKYNAILLLSGGIDSTLVLAKLSAMGGKILCLIFDYDQKLIKENDFAVANAKLYKQDYQIIKLPGKLIFPACNLIGTNGALPQDRTLTEIEQQGAPPSYVPFRNGVFLSIAVAIGEGLGVKNIICGGNGLNSGNYPDDTKEFASAFEAAAWVGTQKDYACNIVFPNSEKTKKQIVDMAKYYDIDLEKTWSCYLNGEKHCGKCDSCIQRREAGAPR